MTTHATAGDDRVDPGARGVQVNAASGVPSAISADLLRPLPRGANWLMGSLVGLVVVFFGWASVAILEETASGEGRVVPASKIQIVQNLEGGIVREVLVQESQTVTRGDIILRIDPTQAGASVGESRERIVGLRAAVARLEAEADGKALSFPDDLVKEHPEMLARQRQQFEARQDELNSALAALKSLEEQRAQELRELASKIETSKRALELAREELKILRPLARSRAVSRSEVLAAEAKVNDTVGALSAAELAVPRVEAQLREAAERRREKRQALRAQSLQDLNKARVELNALGEATRSSTDQLARTTVRAPATGIVKTVHITTPGQVVKPGDDLIEIVPLNDTLLVEARIRPQDIAFLRPEQEALVKLTAYDFAIYGGLKGRVETIGADSVTNEREETFYLIQVRTEKGTIEHGGKELKIIPGMVAEVDIRTGQKTVLEYLLKPLTRMRHTSMRER